MNDRVFQDSNQLPNRAYYSQKLLSCPELGNRSWGFKFLSCFIGFFGFMIWLGVTFMAYDSIQRKATSDLIATLVMFVPLGVLFTWGAIKLRKCSNFSERISNGEYGWTVGNLRGKQTGLRNRHRYYYLMFDVFGERLEVEVNSKTYEEAVEGESFLIARVSKPTFYFCVKDDLT
ncbi:MAG: hypothetical protein K6F51_14735 [Acetatifactor sp.]|nr:hypothetical protein [Acetatifactor sp.]